jgi:hypothetical protein
MGYFKMLYGYLFPVQGKVDTSQDGGEKGDDAFSQLHGHLEIFFFMILQ